MAVNALDKSGCKKCFRQQQRESLDIMTFGSDKDAKNSRVKCLTTLDFKLALPFE